MSTITLPINIDECIDYARAGVARFEGLQSIITENDFSKWKHKLESVDDVAAYLWGDEETGADYTLLSAAVLVGYQGNRMLAFGEIVHAERLLNRLDGFIRRFPQLTVPGRTSKQFADKIKNLADFHLLATLSELTLAYWFAKQGFTVEFETPFTHPVTGKRKDADLTITSSAGSQMHVEVYTPNKRFEADGFVDLEGEANRYLRKIEYKLEDKFGSGEISELNGKVLLAVNQTYFDAARLQQVLADLGQGESYEGIAKRLPLEIDGILIFEDDFSRTDSFVLRVIQVKP
ncbi:hypothetical protein BN8_p06811 (plasmid) [Fibrisoma limi BUZ 3]|uniref:Uncharacterized protein n=2 Tax=Fibrisoma limi TaxID=663275 RepID=I2GU14_9BACT|nr:hypothetical protein BN8_p06811 [Fibrisoma limi BUZ 3]